MQNKHIKKNVASLKKSQNFIDVSFIKWIISSCATRGGRLVSTNHMIQGNPADIFTIRLKKLLSRCLGVHEFHINVTVFHGNIIDNGEIPLRSILLVSTILLSTLEVLPEIRIILMLFPSGTNWWWFLIPLIRSAFVNRGSRIVSVFLTVSELTQNDVMPEMFWLANSKSW